MMQPLTSTHIAAIAALDDVCFQEGPFCEEVLTPMFALDGFFAYGQFEEGELIACVLGHSVLDEAELWSIAVHPDYRKKGLGKNGMQLFFDVSRAKGAKEAFWEVRLSNTYAQALYTKLGAECFGRRKNFYELSQPLGAREDALLYRYAL